MTEELSGINEIPVLALRDVVVYPQMVIPLFVGREKSIRCLDIAMENDKQVFLVAQKDAAVDDPTADDVYRAGTIATILQMLKLPDGTVKVLVEGARRARITQTIAKSWFVRLFLSLKVMSNSIKKYHLKC
jgi:ATP-dependent Lon protease